MHGLEWIEPDWPRHARVRAAATTRSGGVSAAPYASLNLGSHVGDAPACVAENRRRLERELRLPASPAWLEQVHGIDVAHILATAAVPPRADAAWTQVRRTPLAILTADCLPVLIADDDGLCVAAAHAGWRGLAAGVLEHSVRSLPLDPGRLSAWLGPAVGPAAFEVGPEVRDAFVQRDADARQAFVAAAGDRLLCDLYLLARQRLAQAGVTRVFGGNRCTHREADRFHSYRRDGVCGRMATLVWLA